MADDNNAPVQTDATTDPAQNTGAQDPARADTTETAASSGQDTASDAGAEGQNGEGEGEGQQVQAKAKPKGGFQRRIDQLTSEKSDAQRERDYWRDVALKGQKPDDGKTPPPVDGPDQPPKASDFQDYESYLTAKAKYEFRQEARAEERARQQETMQRQTQELQQTFRKSVDQARERYEDFDDVVANLDGITATPAIARAIMTAERGADLVYYLGSHPDEAARIAKLDPLSAARELGRLEGKLPQATPRKISSAPNPPSTVKGGEAPTRDPSKMSMEEYAAWRKKSA